jgi:hypothetical protein
MWVDLCEAPLELERVVREVSHAGAGAVDVFVGVVRDHNDGRSVTRLEYQAYAPMALAEMQRICTEIEASTPSVRVAADAMATVLIRALRLLARHCTCSWWVTAACALARGTCCASWLQHGCL